MKKIFIFFVMFNIFFSVLSLQSVESQRADSAVMGTEIPQLEHGQYALHVLMKSPFDRGKKRIHFVHIYGGKEQLGKEYIWTESLDKSLKLESEGMKATPVLKSFSGLREINNKHKHSSKLMSYDIWISISGNSWIDLPVPKTEPANKVKDLNWTEELIQKQAKSYFKELLKTIEIDPLDVRTWRVYDFQRRTVYLKTADFIRVCQEIMNPNKFDNFFSTIKRYRNKTEFVTELNKEGPLEFYKSMREDAVSRGWQMSGSSSKTNIYNSLDGHSKLLWPDQDSFFLTNSNLSDIEFRPSFSTKEDSLDSFKNYPYDIVGLISIKSKSKFGPIDEIETSLWGDGLSQVEVVIKDGKNTPITVAVHDLRVYPEEHIAEVLYRLNDPLMQLPDGRIPMGTSKIKIKRSSEVNPSNVFLFEGVKAKSFIKRGDGKISYSPTSALSRPADLSANSWNMAVLSTQRSQNLDLNLKVIKNVASSWEEKTKKLEELSTDTMNLERKARGRYDYYNDQISKTLVDRNRILANFLQNQTRLDRKLNPLRKDLQKSQTFLRQAQDDMFSSRHQYHNALRHQNELRNQKKNASRESKHTIMEQMKLMNTEIRKLEELAREENLKFNKACAALLKQQNSLLKETHKLTNSFYQEINDMKLPNDDLGFDAANVAKILEEQHKKNMDSGQKALEETENIMKYQLGLIENQRRLEENIKKAMSSYATTNSSPWPSHAGFIDPFPSHSRATSSQEPFKSIHGMSFQGPINQNPYNSQSGESSSGNINEINRRHFERMQQQARENQKKLMEASKKLPFGGGGHSFPTHHRKQRKGYEMIHGHDPIKSFHPFVYNPKTGRYEFK